MVRRPPPPQGQPASWLRLLLVFFSTVGLNAKLRTLASGGKALAVLRRMIGGDTVTQSDSGLSPREWRELQALLGGE